MDSQSGKRRIEVVSFRNGKFEHESNIVDVSRPKKDAGDTIWSGIESKKTSQDVDMVDGDAAGLAGRESTLDAMTKEAQPDVDMDSRIDDGRTTSSNAMARCPGGADKLELIGVGKGETVKDAIEPEEMSILSSILASIEIQKTTGPNKITKVHSSPGKSVPSEIATVGRHKTRTEAMQRILSRNETAIAANESASRKEDALVSSPDYRTTGIVSEWPTYADDDQGVSYDHEIEPYHGVKHVNFDWEDLGPDHNELESLDHEALKLKSVAVRPTIDEAVEKIRKGAKKQIEKQVDQLFDGEADLGDKVIRHHGLISGMRLDPSKKWVIKRKTDSVFIKERGTGPGRGG